MEEIYAGSNWVKESLGAEPSDFGSKVADLLGEWQFGIYHISKEVTHERTDFTRNDWVEIVLGGQIATYDFNSLTRLIFLCHEYGIRCEIRGASYGYLRFVFHNPEFTGVEHITMEKAFEYFRKSYKGTEL